MAQGIKSLYWNREEEGEDTRKGHNEYGKARSKL